jgi:thioredoxin 1
MNSSQDNSLTVEIGEADFEAEVLKSKQPVLVAFWAPWSRPCQVLKPVLDEVAAACAGKVKVVTINADDNPGLGVEYEIQSIPLLLCFVEGVEQARIVGTASKEAVLSRLRPFAGTA